MQQPNSLAEIVSILLTVRALQKIALEFDPTAQSVDAIHSTHPEFVRRADYIFLQLELTAFFLLQTHVLLAPLVQHRYVFVRQLDGQPDNWQRIDLAHLAAHSGLIFGHAIASRDFPSLELVPACQPAQSLQRRAEHQHDSLDDLVE